jgi:hypothetical protein
VNETIPLLNWMKPRHFILALLSLLIAYPLSIGPAAVLEMKFEHPLVLSPFYAPLWSVAGETNTEDFMVWYYNRWLAYCFGWKT